MKAAKGERGIKNVGVESSLCQADSEPPTYKSAISSASSSSSAFCSSASPVSAFLSFLPPVMLAATLPPLTLLLLNAGWPLPPPPPPLDPPPRPLEIPLPLAFKLVPGAPRLFFDPPPLKFLDMSPSPPFHQKYVRRSRSIIVRPAVESLSGNGSREERYSRS